MRIPSLGMSCVIRRWPKDGLTDNLEELVDSDILIESDDASLEWIDELTNTLRLDAEINAS